MTDLRAEAPVDARRSGLVPSWPLILGLAAFLRAFRNPLDVLADPDTYLHVAAGRWMVAHRALPRHDPFSHSLAGAPWVAHEWLAEVILALVHAALGWGGLVVLTASCFAVTIGLLNRRLLDQCEPISALIATVLAGLVLLPHVLARPHMLALPLLALWSAEVIRARDAGRVPSYWLLPVMTLWANLHGGFMFGLALAGFFAVEAAIEPAARGRRVGVAWRWGLFLLAAAAVTLLTPNGLAGFLQPFAMLRMPVLQAGFQEWQGPNFQHFEPVEVWLLGLLLLALCGGFRLRWTRAVLLLGLVHMTLQHARHADLLGLVAPLAMAASLGPQVARVVRSDPPSPVARGAARLARPAGLAASALVVTIGLAWGALWLRHPLVRPDGGPRPAAALAAARTLGLTGPVLNAEGFGGYLVYRGVPTFIDGRAEMYGDAFLKRYFEAVSGEEPALDEVLDRYRITWTLLSPQNAAVRVLDHLPGWRRTYADKTAVIHVRTTALPP
jgi:hypothetical protein